MINASKEFKEKLKNGGTVVNYADVTLSDGTVLHLEPKDIMIGGCTIDDKTTDGKFGVGFVIGKTLSLQIANHDERFSLYDFYKSTIYLYVAMQIDDGSVEKIRKGVYYTTVPETPGDVIELSSVDGMYRLDKDYASSTTVYPATLQTIVSNACLDCGIPIGFAQFDKMGYVVQEKPEKATYREIMSWACQIAGYNARIDNDGYMQLVRYNTGLMDRKLYDGGNLKVYQHEKILDGGSFTDYSTNKIISGGLFTDEEAEHIFRFKTLNIHTDDVVITGVRVKNDETEGFFGEEGYVITLEDNPFTAGSEQDHANYLGLLMVGLTFRPFYGSVLGNPLYEPFDVCRVSDRKGNMFRTLINSVSYTVGSYTEIACEAEDPVRNGSVYASPAAAAVVEARRNTEKQITDYDKAVQNMNQIAMNAMGFHTTYEEQPDGSRITYLHEKPTLSDSKIIYKQTIDGFFVSQDGGKSYTSGFDSHGNAVVNILYAIGIVADWIRTGHLSADRINGGTLIMGGAGNTNGKIIILDANGNQIGTWDNNGILTTKGNFSGHVTAYSLTLGADASISAQKITGLAGVATSGSYNDLSNKPAIPTVPSNIITEDEVSVTTSTDANGVVTKTIKVGDETYTVKYSDNYVITNVGLGSQNSDKTNSYFKVSREGLLEANNALIYGTVYARNGQFSGDVNANVLSAKDSLGIYIGDYGVNSVADVARISRYDDVGGKRLYDLVLGKKYGQLANGSGYDDLVYNRATFPGPVRFETKVYALEDMKVYEELHAGKLRVGGLSGLIGEETEVVFENLPTNSSSANVRIGTKDPIGKIYRSTASSKRYKNTIRPLGEIPDISPEKIYEFDIVSFRYNDEYLPKTDQRYGMDIPGLISDDVYKKYPIACNLDDEGRPEMWEINILFPASLKLIQDQHKEIEDLKTRVAKLESQMEALLNGNHN